MSCSAVKVHSLTPPQPSAAATVCICHALKLSLVLQVCYYRDKNSINKFQKAKVTAEGVTVSDAFALDTKWSYRHFENPALHAQGTW